MPLADVERLVLGAHGDPPVPANDAAVVGDDRLLAAVALHDFAGECRRKGHAAAEVLQPFQALEPRGDLRHSHAAANRVDPERAIGDVVVVLDEVRSRWALKCALETNARWTGRIPGRLRTRRCCG